MEIVETTIGERIEDLIKYNEIDAKTLVDRINEKHSKAISEPTMSDIINNVNKAYSYKYFVYIAEYFDVSVDYLLGLKKDSFSPKEQEIEFVCNYTGLSKKAIEKIVNYKNHSEANTVPLFSSQLEPLNKILETNDIDDLLMFISRYFYKKEKYGKQDASSIVNIYSILNQNSKPTEYELQAIELFNAQNLFSNMIERIGKEYEQKKG